MSDALRVRMQNSLAPSSLVQVQWRVTVNALATGQTVILPVNNGVTGINYRFVPRGTPHVELIARTGTLTTPAILRVGNNGSFNNLVALSTLTGLSTVNNITLLTIAATPASLDISSAAIQVDVQTAATGPSVYSLEVVIEGFLRS